MPDYRNTTATVRAILSACEKAGVDPGALLSEVGIARQVAQDIDGEIPLAQMRDLWVAAYQASRDPHLALHAAREAALGAYKSIDYMLLNSPDLGAAVGRLVRYFRLVNTWLQFELQDRADSHRLILSSELGAVPPPAAEFAFAVLTERLRIAVGPQWNPLRVTFCHPAPPGAEAYDRFFGCRVVFSEAQNGFFIDGAAWEKQIANRDPALFRLAKEHADMLMKAQRPTSDLVERLRAGIADALQDGEPQRDQMARTLGMSGRTLHRRLSENGVTFAKLVETVQQDLAQSYLRNGDLALSEVAFLVGFSDQSAFSRAFKRWTGITPRQHRQALIEGKPTSDRQSGPNDRRPD
jgi:AraC-like DNA-binding protein